MTFESNDSKNLKAIKLDHAKNDFEIEEDREIHEISDTESQIDPQEVKGSKSTKVNFNKQVQQYSENDLSSDDDEYGVLPKPPYHHIIIDCSPLNYIDTFAVKTIHQVFLLNV